MVLRMLTIVVILVLIAAGMTALGSLITDILMGLAPRY